MIRTYHLTIDLAWAQRRTTRELRDMLRLETGESVSGWAVRRLLREAYALGYTVLPVCDAHNAKGYCLGHGENSHG